MRERFEGRTIVVTGGASGIGLATVERLVDEGGRVAVFDAQAHGAPQPPGDGRLETVFHQQVDITDVGAVERAVRAVSERWGRIDALVNSAGVLRWGTTVETTEVDWDAVMDVNLKGTWLVSREVARTMLEADGGGAIVHVASNMGVRGVANQVAYSASKGGVIALTRSMARDLGPAGIRVNCVNPGHVSTPMGDSAAERLGLTAEGIRDGYPLGRMGIPAEQAAAIAFLASDDAAFVTGAIVAVDGGNTA